MNTIETRTGNDPRQETRVLRMLYLPRVDDRMLAQEAAHRGINKEDLIHIAVNTETGAELKAQFAELENEFSDPQSGNNRMLRSVNLPKSMDTALRRAAAAQTTTVQAVIRARIHSFLKRLPTPAP